MRFGVYSENDVLQLVALIDADNYDEAVEKARKLGYGKSYRVEEDWEE